MWCPSCIFFYDDIMDMREDFAFQHVTEYLVQNLDKLDLRPQPETIVSLHYHTGRPQSDAEARSALTLLRALPGVTVVDIGSDERFGRHCTPAVRQQIGPEAWDEMSGQWVQKAVDAGADAYATLYHGCQRHMCGLEAGYPVRVEHYLTLVGRAPRHRIRRPVQEAHPTRRHRRHPGRNRPLRRSQQHPDRGGEGGHRSRVPGAARSVSRNKSGIRKRSGFEVEPFSLSVGMMLPHQPSVARKEDYDEYVGKAPMPRIHEPLFGQPPPLFPVVEKEDWHRGGVRRRR